MNKSVAVLALICLSFVLWSIYLANTGGRSIFFDYSQSIPDGDKYGHMVLYGVLSLLMNFTFKCKVVRLFFLPVYLGSLLVFIFTLLEEVSQDFIPSRTMDIHDMYANCIGIAVSIVITYIVTSIIRLNKQSSV